MATDKVIPPLGSIEPHEGLLEYPPEGQLLYKIIKSENFANSLSSNYLYFNRVDSYSDFPGADSNDGEQLPNDKKINEKSLFANSSDFTAKQILREINQIERMSKNPENFPSKVFFESAKRYCNCHGKYHCERCNNQRGMKGYRQTDIDDTGQHQYRINRPPRNIIQVTAFPPATPAA